MLATLPLTGEERTTLAKLSIFAGLPDAELDAVCASMRRRTYRRGEVIHHIDDVAGDVFVITQGHVKHRQVSPDGRQITHRIHGAGNAFGLMSVLDHQRRAGDAVALTDCEVLVMDRDCFIEFLDRHPEATEIMLRHHVASLRHMQELVYELAFLSVPARLAKALLRYAECEPGSETPLLPPYLNQTELAFLVGTSRETVNQTLKSFSQRGWIEMRGRQVRLLDVEELHRQTT